jgi:tRNA pseudouridine65 synthase
MDGQHTTTRSSLVEAMPQTGRRHQIRRHLKHLSHPIIGDATHGKGPLNRWWAERLGRQRLWLHACGLGFKHPVTGAALRIESPWQTDADWCALLDALRARGALESHGVDVESMKTVPKAC